MSRLGVESSIIDRIYETAFLPELWVDVLDRIALLARCDGGFLFSVDAQQRVRAVTSERYGPLLDAYVAGGNFKTRHYRYRRQRARPES